MLNETCLAVKPIKLIKGPAHGISYIARLRKQWKHNCLGEICLFLCFVSALTGAGKSSTFGLARIFRTTVSFLSAQFRQMLKCWSQVNLLHYLLSGDQFKIQTSFGQFSFKIFLRNHFSTEWTNLLFRSTQEERTHIRLFWSIGVEPILSAIQFKDFQM